MNTIIHKLMIALQGDERAALIRLAEQERRDPRQQAAVIIREDLQRRGFLRHAGEVVQDCQVSRGGAQ